MTLKREDIQERDHPKNQTTEQIRKEASELADIYYQSGSPIGEAIENRWQQMFTVLDERTDVELPACPNCGSQLGYEPEGTVLCQGLCGGSLPDEVIGEYKEKYRTMWEPASE